MCCHCDIYARDISDDRDGNCVVVGTCVCTCVVLICTGLCVTRANCVFHVCWTCVNVSIVLHDIGIIAQ